MTYNEVVTYVVLIVLSLGLTAVVVSPLIPGWLAWLSRDKDEKPE